MGSKTFSRVSSFPLKNGYGDPKKLGIMGGSYGGYIVTVGITEYPDMFAAAADLFGIINFFTFFEHTEPWMAAISTTEYGDPKTQADLLRRLSPIYGLIGSGLQQLFYTAPTTQTFQLSRPSRLWRV